MLVLSIGRATGAGLLPASSAGQDLCRGAGLWSVGIWFGEYFRHSLAGCSLVLVVVSNIACYLVDYLRGMFADGRTGRFLNSGCTALEGADRALCIVDRNSVGQVAKSGPFDAPFILQRAVFRFPFGSLHWRLVNVGVLVLIGTGYFRSGRDGFL